MVSSTSQIITDESQRLPIPCLPTSSQLVFIKQEDGGFFLIFYFKGDLKLSSPFSDTVCKIYRLSFTFLLRALSFFIWHIYNFSL